MVNVGKYTSPMDPLIEEIRSNSPVEVGRIFPIIYRVLYIQTVVVWDFFHQQYDSHILCVKTSKRKKTEDNK